MKKIFNKFSNMPVSYVATIMAILITIIVLIAQGNMTLAGVFGIAILGILLGLQIHLGSIVLKSLASGFIIIYVSSMYTYLIINTHGYITQPFLLSIAAITTFLAQTYNKSHNYGLRSRGLWSSILSILLISFKSAIILNGNGFWMAEVVGLNLLIIYILAWRIWIANSKKTKIIEPEILEEETKGKYKYIYIQNKLDAVNNIWNNGKPDKQTNAYPWIYNEAMKAHEENLILILISKFTTNEIYDVGEININRSKKIPYLYMEAKDDEYKDVILMKFSEEIMLTNNQS